MMACCLPRCFVLVCLYHKYFYTFKCIYLEKQEFPEPSGLSPGAVAGILCAVLLFVVAFGLGELEL